MDPLDLLARDRELTRKNREKLMHNQNLVSWYRNLYMRQFSAVPDVDHATILEIGSGTSPLKLFHSNVITSDIMTLDYLDFIFDCHEIDRFAPIADSSLDIITMTNVLHHLKAPLEFLVKAAVKLKPGGRVIITEPFFSAVSTVIYRYIHHEPTRFDIKEPELDITKGPLSSANIALPYLIFFSNDHWHEHLSFIYDYDLEKVRHYSSLSYMATGGISRRIPFPTPLYKKLLTFDLMLADRLPKFFSSFFILEMTKKMESLHGNKT